MQTLTVRIPLGEPTKRKAALLERASQEFQAAGEWYLERLQASGGRNGKRKIHTFYAEACGLFAVNRASLQEAAQKAETLHRSQLTLRGKYPMRVHFPFRVRQDSYRLVQRQGYPVIKFPTLKGRNQVALPLLADNFSLSRLQDLWAGRCRQGSAELIFARGRWWAHISLTFPTEPLVPQDVIGLDLGVVKLAVTSRGRFFNGKAIRFRQERLFRQRKALQEHGRLARVKRRRGKERRWKAHVNHILSKQVVEEARRTRSALVLENLRHIRSRSLGTKRFRRMIHAWSFGQLIAFIRYKAKLAGVPVIVVDPRGSSTTCSRCGAKGARDRAEFHCRVCGLHLNSDLNAARVLRQRGMSLLAGELSPPLWPRSGLGLMLAKLTMVSGADFFNRLTAWNSGLA